MSNPEPTDVGPIAGGHLPAGESDRAQVRLLLHTAHADGRITTDELRQRVAVANTAETFDDLVPLTRDLVDFRSPGARGGVVASRAPQTSRALVDPSQQNPERELLLGVFGGTTRKGTWRLRRETTAIAVMGGHDLDLTDAVFEDDICTIRIVAVFGGVSVKVPAGVRVVDEMGAIFGGSEVRNTDDLGGGGPTLVIKGFAMFGGVEVKGPKPGAVDRLVSKMLGVD